MKERELLVGIIGAGSIGRGLAYGFASALNGDCCVVLCDTNPKVLEAAKGEILQLADKGHLRGKISATVKSRILSCFEFGTSLRGGPQSRTDFDLVVEAATENLELKRSILAEVEKIVPETTLIGFTTSSLPAAWIAKHAEHPQRCMVMHPFFPAWKNPVMELTRSGNPEVTARAEALLKKLGKVPVTVADSPLFAGNILFCGLMDCACRMAAAGIATPQQINDVLAREIGGGGVFFVHDMIPNANNLTAECLEVWRSERLFGYFDPMATMLRGQGNTKWIDQDDAEPVGEKLARKIAGIAKAYLGCLALHLIDDRVIDPFDLNWISRTALAFRTGVIEMVSEMGLVDLDHWTEVMDREGILNFGLPAMLDPDAATGHPRDYAVYRNVKVEIDDDGVATLTVFRPPVNPLNAATILELDAALKRLDKDPGVKGVVFTGFNGVLAGADVTELADLRGKPEEMAQFPRAGQILTLSIEAMSKPVVAVVNGLCLGGGAEMAMACWARVIGPDAMIGQPEVNLGIIPGYGGTQRLPRLVGVERALQMLRTGKPIDAMTALEWGWATAINRDPVGWARQMILTHGKDGFMLKPIDARPMKPGSIPAMPTEVELGHLSKAVDDILVSTVMNGIVQPLADGLLAEAKASGKCGETEDHLIGLTNFMANGPKVKAQFVHR